MKKMLSFVLVTAFLLTMATVATADVSEPASGTVTMDTSIFFEHPEEPAECMDEMLMGLCHEYKQGVSDIVFFEWSDRFEKMPPLHEFSCFAGRVSGVQTIVFLDGVPNLVNDLFKAWEGTTQDVYIPDSVKEIEEDCFVQNSTIHLHFTENNEVALAYAKTHGMRYEIMGKGWGGPLLFDTSIFELPAEEEFEFHEDTSETYLTCSCTDSDYLGIYHYARGDGKSGVTFYKWMNTMERMPPHVEDTCFGGVPADPYLKTVVFWNGVPNLVNDLFKAWEGTTQDVYIPDSVKEIEKDCFVKGSSIKLHFTENNAVALAYAKTRRMAFEVMDAKERLPGDANFDKSADMKDVLTLRQLIAHIPTAYEIYSTDLTGDKSTDMKDVLTLRQQIAVTAEYYE